MCGVANAREKVEFEWRLRLDLTVTVACNLFPSSFASGLNLNVEISNFKFVKLRDLNFQFGI